MKKLTSPFVFVLFIYTSSFADSSHFEYSEETGKYIEVHRKTTQTITAPAETPLPQSKPTEKFNPSQFAKLVIVRGSGNADEPVDVYIDGCIRVSVEKDSYSFFNIPPGMHYLSFVIDDSYRTVRIVYQDKKFYYYNINISEVMNNKFGAYTSLSKEEGDKLITGNKLALIDPLSTELLHPCIEEDKWEDEKEEADEDYREAINENSSTNN